MRGVDLSLCLCVPPKKLCANFAFFLFFQPFRKYVNIVAAILAGIGNVAQV